ncbi:hypothetical protein GCM10017779_02730 [Streptomyces capillispiralis]|nr:hypothetical protein GCM10017779_02730 [Streptomyces capillispiralis]
MAVALNVLTLPRWVRWPTGSRPLNRPGVRAGRDRARPPRPTPQPTHDRKRAWPPPLSGPLARFSPVLTRLAEARH